MRWQNVHVFKWFVVLSFFAEQNLDNMNCEMENEDKGFDPYTPEEQIDENTILNSTSPNLTPPVKDTPGFVFSSTLVSLLGAVVYISKRDE